MGTGYVETALRLGFHRMTRQELTRAGQQLLSACPSCAFSGLNPGKTYAYADPHPSELLAVAAVTPKRTQATVSINGKALRKIHKGRYSYGTFYELTDDLISLGDRDFSHEDVVREAVDRGYDIPPAVRREYPWLFVEIPERFAVHSRHSARERVKESLRPPWLSGEPVTVETIDKCIETVHRDFQGMHNALVQRRAVDLDTEQDYARQLAKFSADIEYYRWLRRLIDKGGVFHIPDGENRT